MLSSCFGVQRKFSPCFWHCLGYFVDTGDDDDLPPPPPSSPLILLPLLFPLLKRKEKYCFSSSLFFVLVLLSAHIKRFRCLPHVEFVYHNFNYLTYIICINCLTVFTAYGKPHISNIVRTFFPVCQIRQILQFGMST